MNSVGAKIAAGFAVAVLLVVLFRISAYTTTRELIDVDRQTTQTRLVLEQLDDIRLALQAAESSQRGFVLTGQDAYLDPYRKAVPLVPQYLKNARDLMRDDPAEQLQLDQVESLTQERLSELRETISLRQKQGMQAALDLTLTNLGEATMDQISQVLSAMRDDELTRLSQETVEARAKSASTLAAMLWGIPLAVALLGLVTVTLTRHIARPLRQMTTVAERLARGDLTAEVPPTRRGDEVGKLAQSFARMTLWLKHAAGVAEQIAEGDLEVRVIPQSPQDQLGHSLATMIENLRTITSDLRRSEERFRLLFQQAAVGIKRLDPDGRVLEVNDRLCEVFGYSREELLQLSLKDFTYPDDIPTELAEIRKLLNREIPYYSLEKRCRRKDGETIWVRVTSSLPLHESGPAPWWISVVEDITARKEAEEHLRETADDLARSNRDLEQFAYVSSHDLQEPLRMVVGFMQLFQEQYADKVDDAGRKYITFAVDGSKRMQALIDDLLAYSRVGSQGREFEPVDMRKALQGAMDNLKLTIEETQTEIVTHDPLPTVHGDATQLAHLFQNLLGNAIKFRDDKRPRIEIGAQREERHWKFFVRDNGIGINPEYREKIFVIFQRLHTRKQYPGTGLGLAICKRIIDRHGGRIWVESREGEGSTFFFTLPG